MTSDERRAIDELAGVHVGEVLAGTISALHSQAVIRLGLVRGSEQHRDPAQASLAIDAIAALLPIAERVLPPAAGVELKQALSQLRLAFAESAGAAAPPSSDAGGEPGPPPVDPPPPPPRPSERPKIWTPRGEV